jgi:hypothetical protein
MNRIEGKKDSRLDVFLNLNNGQVNWSQGYYKWQSSACSNLQKFHNPLNGLNKIPDRLVIEFDLITIPKKRKPMRIMKGRRWAQR